MVTGVVRKMQSPLCSHRLEMVTEVAEESDQTLQMKQNITVNGCSARRTATRVKSRSVLRVVRSRWRVKGGGFLTFL